MRCAIALLLLLPAIAMADGAPPFGMSGDVTGTQRTHDVGAATQRALEQQRHSSPAEQSEFSVPVYIDTQRRLADSFKQPIPETFGRQTRGEE